MRQPDKHEPIYRRKVGTDYKTTINTFIDDRMIRETPSLWRDLSQLLNILQRNLLGEQEHMSLAKPITNVEIRNAADKTKPTLSMMFLFCTPAESLL
jgi:hypothetical protein